VGPGKFRHPGPRRYATFHDGVFDGMESFRHDVFVPCAFCHRVLELD
jgi:hypothetical protein